MKKTAFIFTLVLFASSFALAGDSGKIKIIGEFEHSEVSISIPDEITLPKVAKGYDSNIVFPITNDGNLGINVNFMLESISKNESYNTVFDLLQIGKENSQLFPIGEKEYGIKPPMTLDSELTENFELYLRLPEDFNSSYSNIEEVFMTVTAVPA